MQHSAFFLVVVFLCDSVLLTAQMLKPVAEYEISLTDIVTEGIRYGADCHLTVTADFLCGFAAEGEKASHKL